MSRWVPVALVLMFVAVPKTSKPWCAACEHNSLLEQVTFGPIAEAGPTCSPNHQWLAFEYFLEETVKETDSEEPIHWIIHQIWIMPMHGEFSASKAIAGDAYYAGISWSPDSRWISLKRGSKPYNGSWTGDQIVKVRVPDGEVVQITDFPQDTKLGDDTAWSRDGRIAFQKDGNIYAVPEEGGEPSKLVDVASQGITLDDPAFLQWSPDGSQIAFVAQEEASHDWPVWVANLQRGEAKQLTVDSNSCCLSWVNDHKLLISKTPKSGQTAIYEETAIYGIKVQTGQMIQLTEGPIDFAPCWDAEHQMLFYNHSEQARPEIVGFMVPRIHIWRRRLSGAALDWLVR